MEICGVKAYVMASCFASPMTLKSWKGISNFSSSTFRALPIFASYAFLPGAVR